MTNSVTWSSPDQVQAAQGQINPGIVYIVDPATGKVISPAGSGSGVSDVIATGNLTAAQATQATPVANATVVLALGSGQATWEAQITGLGSGSTVAFDGVDDTGTSTNWQAAIGYNASIVNPTPISSIAGPGPFIIRGSASGYEQVRVRCTIYNGTDTIAVRLIGSVGALAGVGGLVSNDGTFAKESGGNLATLVANTADLLADGDNLPTIATNTGNIPAKGTAAMAGSTPVTIATNDTTFAEVLTDLDNLGTIATNTTGVATAANQSTANTSLSNISTVQGATTDAAVVGDNNGSLSAKLRGLTKILNDIWDSTNHLFHFNIKQVGGNAIAPGNNALPILNSASTGYVSAYGSNAAALTANTDYLYKWGAGGTTQVNHVMLQNNGTVNLNWDLDVATSAGSPVLAPGQTLFLDVQTTVVHLQANGTPNVNGTSATNVVVRGWL